MVPGMGPGAGQSMGPGTGPSMGPGMSPSMGPGDGSECRGNDAGGDRWQH